MYTLIVTAKLNEIDPQARLTDVIGRISHKRISELDRLLQWHWASAGAHNNLAA